MALRAIAGFAQAHWISREAYAPPPNTLAESEPDILEHMNTDHANTLLKYAHAQGLLNVAAVTMIGIDCDGFDLNAGEKTIRFEFETPVTGAEAARAALVALAQKVKNV